MITVQSIGKVAITPKGTWSSTSTYEIFDLVTYGSSSYLAKKTSANKVPTNTTYWALIAAGGVAAPSIDSNGILYWPTT